MDMTGFIHPCSRCGEPTPDRIPDGARQDCAECQVFKLAEQRPYPCRWCRKGFETDESRSDHTRAKHSNK